MFPEEEHTFALKQRFKHIHNLSTPYIGNFCSDDLLNCNNEAIE